MFMTIKNVDIFLGFKKEFSKLVGFPVTDLIDVRLIFNANDVKNVLLELINHIFEE